MEEISKKKKPYNNKGNKKVNSLNLGDCCTTGKGT